MTFNPDLTKFTSVIFLDSDWDSKSYATIQPAIVMDNGWLTWLTDWYSIG